MFLIPEGLGTFILQLPKAMFKGQSYSNYVV